LAIIIVPIVTYGIYRLIRRRAPATNKKRLSHHSHDESHANLSAQVDSYAYTNKLAKTSPATKMFLAASMLLLSVLSPYSIVPIIVFAASLTLILAVAKIPAHFYFDLLIYPLVFAALSCIFIALFFGTGAALVEIPFPWFTWTIYTNGITTALTTFFRVLGGVSSLFFLVLTTTMNDLFISLRKIYVPKVLVEMSLLIYRYIFVFMEVASKMTTAQKLRLGQTGYLNRLRQTALLVANLFVRTLEQGERTFTAMNARGYDGNIRVIDDQPKPKLAAILGIIVFDVILALIALDIIHIWSLW